MASRGINKVILIGNLGQEPEVRQMPNGNAVTNITIATSESWKDKNTGEQRENTEWHRVVMFNRLAEIAGQYLQKGSRIYIEGHLQTSKWQNQQGIDQYTTEIVAKEMQMLGSSSQRLNKNTSSQKIDNKADDSIMPEGIWEFDPKHLDDFEDDIPFI